MIKNVKKTEIMVNGRILSWHGRVSLDDNSTENIVIPIQNSKRAKRRDVFAIYNNELVIMNIVSDSQLLAYFKQRYGIQSSAYAKLVRGYIIPGKIVFYKSTKFQQFYDVPAEVLTIMMAGVTDIYKSDKYKLFITDAGRLTELL